MQVAYSLVLFILGIIFAQIFEKSLFFALATGYLWGLFLSVLPSFASLLLFGALNLTFYYFCSFILVLALLVVAVRKRAFSAALKSFRALHVGCVLFFVALASLFTKYNFSVGSIDSLAFYIQPGMQFFSNSPVTIAPLFSSVGVFLSLAHGPVSLWGDEYYYLLHPLLFVSFCAVFTWFFCQSHALNKNFKRLFFWLLAGIWGLSSFFVFFNVFYIHTNMPSAIYLFLAAVCYSYAVRQKDAGLLSLFFAAIFAFSLMRVEAPFFAAGLVFFSGLSFDEFEGIPLSKLGLLFFPISLWNLRLMWMLQGGEGLAGPFLLGGQALGLLLLPAFLWVVKKLQINKGYLRKYALAGAGAVVLLLAFTRFDNFAINIVSIFVNIFFVGRWGSLWWGILILTFFCNKDIQKNTSVHFFIYYVVFYFLSLLLLGNMRVPYRLGWGDSANRMLLTIFPLLFFVVLSSLYRLIWGGAEESSASL